ncbi:hypothetical protein PN4B1_44100 [Paenibacillus naphthalenovorans]|nr:hypothetical protein PN4B1_44100 [Paenibacillus naphthalenovorans]
MSYETVDSLEKYWIWSFGEPNLLLESLLLSSQICVVYYRHPYVSK